MSYGVSVGFISTTLMNLFAAHYMMTFLGWDLSLVGETPWLKTLDSRSC
jgi:hypothetical protein